MPMRAPTASDGWAWTHGSNTLGIFKFDQENMQFSVLGVEREATGARLCFGGIRMIDGEPSDLGRLKPGQTLRLGMTRDQAAVASHVHCQ